MRIFFWVQHFLGAGHYFRIAEIAEKLSDEHDVTILVGGYLPDFKTVSKNISIIQLPMVVVNRFKELDSYDRETSKDSYTGEFTEFQETLDQRREIMLNLVNRLQPDVLVTEYFPLGRRQFSEELVPVIKRAKSFGTRVLCSVREILQGDIRGNLQNESDFDRKLSWEKVYSNAVSDLNKYYDGVMVHGDFKFIPLLATFPSYLYNLIKVPIHHTGYVTSKLPKRDDLCQAAELSRKFGYILVSVGTGGYIGSKSIRYGADAIDATILVWNQMIQKGLDQGRKMVMFLGAGATEETIRTISTRCPKNNFLINRNTTNFLEWMTYADLSISKAGYNTCTDLLATGTPSILIPSSSNLDQIPRAVEFEKSHISSMLFEGDLLSPKFQQLIIENVSSNKQMSDVSLDGAEVSALLITNVNFRH